MNTRRWHALFLVAMLVSLCGCTNRRVSSQFNPYSIVSSRALRSQTMSIQFSPDSKYLLIAGSTGTGTLARYANGDYLLDFKPANKHLRLWHVAKRREVQRLAAQPIFGEGGPSPMLLLPDLKTLVTSWGAWEIKVIDVHKRRPDRIINVRNGYIASMDVSPDGEILALGMTREVQFRDTRTYRLLKTYEHGGQATLVNFGPNSHVVRCTWASRKPHFVDVRTGKRVSTPASTRAYEVTLSPDGKYFANTVKGNSVELWKRDAGKSRRVRTWRSTLVDIDTMQFSRDGKVLAVGGLSSTKTPVQFFSVPSASFASKD